MTSTTAKTTQTSSGCFQSPNCTNAMIIAITKIMIAPILFMALGSGNVMFVGAPSRMSMEGSVLIDIVAYVAFCIGLAFTPLRRAEGRPSSIIAMLSETPGSAIVFTFAAVGLLGFVLAFGSPGRIVEYFFEQSAVTELQHEYDGNLSGFLGVVLRPFLAFSLVAWWARSVDRPRRAGNWASVTGTTRSAPPRCKVACSTPTRPG